MPFHSLELWGLPLDTWTVLGRGPVLLLFALLLRAGLSRGWPVRSALLTTTALGCGLGLGAWLLPSVLGAVGMGIALWLLAQRALGLRDPPLSTLALGLCLVIAIGRIGCLLNGCCFGHPTGLPWGVHYGPDSGAFILHRAMSWIPETASNSLHVHPYPLYECLGLSAWIAGLSWLRRRVASEGAVLALTASFDLMLRGAIEGTRAMVNVPWAPSFHWLGLSALQLALLGAGVLALGLGVLLARCASGLCEGRQGSTQRAGADAREATDARLFIVYIACWAVAYLTAGHTTAFVRQLQIGTLLLAAPALVVSARALHRVRLRPLAVAATCATLLLSLLMDRRASADPASDAAQPGGEEWVYEVDHDMGALVRRRPKDRVWIGGTASGGIDHFRVEEACSGNYQIYDRRGGGAEGRSEWEHPLTKRSVLWLGGALGFASERIQRRVYAENDALIGDHILHVTTGYAQSWVEIEHPYVAVGLSGMGCVRRFVDDARIGDAQRPSRFCGLPGGHLRFGWSQLGLDLGLFDRSLHLGFPGAHLGFSGMIFRGEMPWKHPDDVQARYFVGLLPYPGAHFGILRAQPGSTFEWTLRPGEIVGGGFQLEVDGRGAAVGLHYRRALSD